MILSATFNHEVQSEVKEDGDQMSESDLHSLAVYPPAVTILKLFFPPPYVSTAFAFLLNKSKQKHWNRTRPHSN